MNVSPRLASNDKSNACGGHVERLCKRGNCLSELTSVAYFAYLPLLQLGHAYSLSFKSALWACVRSMPSAGCLSTLLCCVCIILCERPNPQVRWIPANSVVAGVANAEPVWNLANENSVRGPVDEDVMWVAHDTIPTWDSCPSPRPAGVWATAHIEAGEQLVLERFGGVNYSVLSHRSSTEGLKVRSRGSFAASLGFVHFNHTTHPNQPQRGGI